MFVYNNFIYLKNNLKIIMDKKNTRNLKNLILYKDFKALNECLDGSMEKTTPQIKLSTASTQKETNISRRKLNITKSFINNYYIILFF